MRSLCAAILISLGASVAGAQTTSITFQDDFNTFHDYTTGTVPAGGMWSGVYNATNGGASSKQMVACSASCISKT
jgi:hypothetical protein